MQVQGAGGGGGGLGEGGGAGGYAEKFIDVTGISSVHAGALVAEVVEHTTLAQVVMEMLSFIHVGASAGHGANRQNQHRVVLVATDRVVI